MANVELCKYSFEILVSSVSLALPGTAKIFVMMKRGDNKVQTKSLLAIDQKTPVAKFNETLSFGLTLHRQSEGFQEKRVKVTVNAVSSSNKVKVLGECLVDLAVFALETKAVAKIYKLQNCIDKNGFIELAIKATPLEKGRKTESARHEEASAHDSRGEVTSASRKSVKETTPSKPAEEAKSHGSSHSAKKHQDTTDDLTTKYAKLKEKAVKFKRERDEARENEKKLLAQLGKLESERTRASRATEWKREPATEETNDMEELKDDLRLYKQKVNELNKEKGELQTLYSKASAECGTASSRAEQYRKDNEQLIMRMKSLEADCSRSAIECKSLNKAIESSKAKIKELTLKLECKAGEDSNTLTEYKGQTNEIIVDLKRQLKEKEEAIIIKDQKVSEIQLELERAQKGTEINENSLRNELNLVRQKQEKIKEEADEAAELLQRERAGKATRDGRVGGQAAAAAGGGQ